MKKHIAAILLLATAHLATAQETAALQALHAACPGLKTYAPDLTLGKPKLADANLTAQRERGWTKSYLVEVQVSKSPSAKLASEYKATGQMCNFEVESTKLGEVTVAKRACMAICTDSTEALSGATPYAAYLAYGKKPVYAR